MNGIDKEKKQRGRPRKYKTKKQLSKARYKASKKYEDTNYYKLAIRLPIDYKCFLYDKAMLQDISINKYVINLITKDIGI